MAKAERNKHSVISASYNGGDARPPVLFAFVLQLLNRRVQKFSRCRHRRSLLSLLRLTGCKIFLFYHF